MDFNRYLQESNFVIAQTGKFSLQKKFGIGKKVRYPNSIESSKNQEWSFLLQLTIFS